MIKKALRFAIGPSVVIVIGSVIFRMTNPALYNETWPSIPIQIILYLVVSYIAGVFVGLIIEWVKLKLDNGK